MPARGERLGPALLVALLVASLVIGILVYHARTPDLALEVVEIDREVERGSGVAEIVFFVRFDEPDATVQIVGKNKVLARTLATELELSADETVRCVWDGQDDAGDPVPRGRYRLRVVLPGQDRDMVFPRRFDVIGGGGDADLATAVEIVGDPCSAGGSA